MNHRVCFALTILLSGCAPEAYVFSDPDAWVVHDGEFELVQQSTYRPPHRSPLNIALLADRQYDSFTLEAELLQTGKEYGHRDMCVFFGFRDPSHYYYAHIASETDAHAHNIFIVNNAPRTKISTHATDGFDWGDGQWHKLKVVRDATTGLIEIHMNGERVMAAMDKTFRSGHVGFGSFDDTGRIRNVRITGRAVSTNPTTFFEHKAPASP